MRKRQLKSVNPGQPDRSLADVHYLHSGVRPTPALFQERSMRMFIVFLIGGVVGVGVTLVGIFMNYVVKDREGWEKEKREMEAAYTCAQKAVAENVKLRVAFAAAEMTEDAKKAAAFGDGIVGMENIE
jgi:hypothetical protein